MTRLTMDHAKMVFGFLLLFTLMVIALVTALGKVEQSTSYGLAPIVTAIAMLAQSFGQWAFRVPREPKSEIGRRRTHDV